MNRRQLGGQLRMMAYAFPSSRETTETFQSGANIDPEGSVEIAPQMPLISLILASLTNSSLK